MALRLIDGRSEDEDRSFEALYRALSGRVLGLCAKMLSDRQAGAEAAGDVWVKVREHYGSYDPAQPADRWVLAIAGHHCVNLLRRRGRERALFDEQADETAPPEGGGAEPGALAALLEREEHAALARALEALPARHRAALVLRYAGGLPYDDIARELGTTRANVAVLLHRAKARLRDALAGPEGSR